MYIPSRVSLVNTDTKESDTKVTSVCVIKVSVLRRCSYEEQFNCSSREDVREQEKLHTGM